MFRSDFSVKNIKNLLIKSYSLSFEQKFSAESQEKMKNIALKCKDIEKFQSLDIEAKRGLFLELIEEIYFPCINVLPLNCYEYVSGFGNEPPGGMKLLEYLLMDSFLNIEHSKMSKKAGKDLQYNSLKEFCNSHICCNYEGDVSHNFSTLARAAKSIPFIYKHFFAEKINKNKIPVLKEYGKVNGILIETICKNPYFTKKPTVKKPVQELKKDGLIHFFNNDLYSNLIKSEEENAGSKFDFSYTEDIEYIKAMHYLDSYFDWMNYLAIACELSDFSKEYAISEKQKNLIVDLLSFCILIPDVFHKDIFVSIIFKMLSSKEKLSCNNRDIDLFCNLDEKDQAKVEADIIPDDVLETNIMLCKEYIFYLSKEFLPVISSCFFVVLYELINDEEKLYEILSIAVSDIVGDYYKEYKNDCKGIIEFREKKSMKFDDWNFELKHIKNIVKDGIDINLVLLYDAIKNNIYSDMETYDRN